MLGPHCLDGSQPNHGGVTSANLGFFVCKRQVLLGFLHKALVRSQWSNPDKVDYDFHGK